MPPRICFYLGTRDEQKLTTARGLEPIHINYTCGVCSYKTSGRVLAEIFFEDKSSHMWCICSCGKHEPCVIKVVDDMIREQHPSAKDYYADEKWPEDLRKLFDEASKCFAAGAYTATATIARKLLMAIACREGATEGASFATYVNYITNEVVRSDRARPTIDAIRSIGNDANHKLEFVEKAGAERALDIVAYLLDAVYRLPGL